VADRLDLVSKALARTLGPVLRSRANEQSTFLDPRGRSHADAMAMLSQDHWERLVHMLALAGAGTVLDVGCGSGDWLAALARFNTRVVGVDIDEDMLSLARARSSGSDNVEIRAVAAEALDLPDGEFDAVTCFTALPYLDQDTALSEMARVLRPAGRLVVGTVGSGYYAKHVAEGIRHEEPDAIRYGLDPILVSAARAVAGDGVARDSLRSWGPRAVRRLLEAQGFAVDRVVRDVGAIDPSWPKSFLGRPMYFIVFATKQGVTGPHQSGPVC
jgi:SAM-dependent methyltransferase